MLEDLKQKVYEANLLLPKYNLVTFTWGNASEIDRERNLVVIKPSGVEYEKMKPEDMVVVNMDGQVVEGRYKPSSDLDTHLEIYRNFKEVGGIVHTHSKWATIFAQAGREIRIYGTTQADYFSKDVPCTRDMTEEEIKNKYEYNTGVVIVERFLNKLNPMEVPAVLVKNHGPFTWGKNALKAVENAVVLEEVANMAFNTELLVNHKKIEDHKLLYKKHFERKHGANAYYGQAR